MFSENSRIELPEIIWLDCKPYGKNQCKKKEYNQNSSGFKEFKNNDPMSSNLRNITFILFECQRSIIKYIDFYFLLLS